MFTIYKIFKINSNDCYIGKTRNISKRMALHKYYCKSSTYKLYEFMRANGGYENFDFEILETNIPEEQGIAKERYYYDIYQPSLNSNVPNRSPYESKLQYRTKNRLEIIQKVKIWQRDNKVKYNSYQKEYQRKKKHIVIEI
jgi:group I intron endonuclease